MNVWNLCVRRHHCCFDMPQEAVLFLPWYWWEINFNICKIWSITRMLHGCVGKSIRQHMFNVLTLEENRYINEFDFVWFSHSHFGNKTCKPKEVNPWFYVGVRNYDTWSSCLQPIWEETQHPATSSASILWLYLCLSGSEPCVKSLVISLSYFPTDQLYSRKCGWGI